MMRKRLLGWVMNAILVLSVISFSAHVSQPKSISNEPARTELKHASRTNLENTFRFGVHYGQAKIEFTHPSTNLYSCLHQYERLIAVKFKSNFADPPIEDKKFLIHYFTYNSESDADDMRG